MSANKPYYVLGLDPGIASCGFALLDLNNHEILEMGANIFDAPQTDKTKTSLAVVRRNARSARRNTKRTRDRQKHCLDLLQGEGLVPEGTDKEWLHSRRGDKPVLRLRVRGLDIPLSEREWAQVLYSLSGRRGYIPHGEVGRNSSAEDAKEMDDGEGRKVLSSIGENRKLMAEGGYRTVGELLASLGRSRNRKGDYSLCVANSQLVDEVKTLFEAQRRLGNAHAEERFEKAFIDCMNWEKRTLDYDAKVYSLVGRCSYFPDELRAANADLSSELCRAYERLGHLRIMRADGREEVLAPDQRKHYLDILFSPRPLAKNKGCTVRYSMIRAELDLSAKDSFKGVDMDREKRDEVFAPRCWRRMRQALPEELLDRMLENRCLADEIGESIAYASTEESLREQLLTRDLDLSVTEVDSICSLPYASKIFQGYGNRSLKALGMLLDAFEEPEIQTLTMAEDASGLANLRLHGERHTSTLLPPYNTFDPTCSNPVVLRSMARMRRIVNAISKLYGVPDEIHVELGRDLKHSKREQREIEKRNKDNKDRRDRIRTEIAEAIGGTSDEVHDNIIHKYELWEEQGGLDAYTGMRIDRQRLLSDDTYCEIDHVLPYSRTCDDSRANKVLVLSSSNQCKRERTPFEWMQEDRMKGAPSWNEFRARVLASHYRQGKKAHLLNDSLSRDEEQRFIDRNMNDTRYMSKAVASYLRENLAFPETGNRKKHVSAVAGGATANLRRAWGLPAKDRSDNRHHAVDAVVIAACNDSLVIKIARISEQKRRLTPKEKAERLTDSEPWPSFADDVRHASDQVVPTRMVNHGVTGKALQETLYRFDGYRDDRSGMGVLHAADGVIEAEGNIKVKNGAARVVGEMAFLRLWLDPFGRAKGKTKGRYYAEPVYYADITDIRNGTYVPKAIKANVARAAWDPVPETAMKLPPLTLFRGDVLCVNGRLGRYWKINIGTRKWDVRDLLSGKTIPDFPRIMQLGTNDDVRVIQEDVLGHCYRNFIRTASNPNETSEMI